MRASGLGCCVVVAGVVGASASTFGQCTPGWLAGSGLAGVDGDVWSSVVWDPDGAGPVTPKFVIGGLFNLVGGTLATNIAMWDPATSQWSALGSGLNDQVDALSVMANGDLVAGGKFTQAGGISANRIARWNGTTWSTFGTGMDNNVRGLFVMPNGDLIAGGAFLHAGAATATRVARWNGSTWAAIGAGFGADVLGFTVWNGDLIAGGVFSGGSGNRVSRWTGTNWQALGNGLNAAVSSFVTLANGDLAVGGIFGLSGSTSIWGVAAWNGTTWSQLGSGLNNNQVTRIIRDVNGDLIAAGNFTVNGSGVARWNGTTWTGIGAALSGTRTLAVFPDGSLFMGGVFETANGARANGIARLDAGVWKAMAPDVGPSSPVISIGVLPNGKVVVSGVFTSASGLANTQNVAVWNGSGWEALTTGVNNSYIESFDVALNGDLIAGGRFSKLGGVTATGVARWDGTAWAPVGGGVSSNDVYVVKVLANGTIVVGGGFANAGGVAGTKCLAKWNGSAWSAFGSGTLTAQFDAVIAIDELPGGDVIIGGYFINAGGVPVNNIARWNGTSWSAMGAGLGNESLGVSSIVHLPNGDIVAAGGFDSAGGAPSKGVARWNGSAWSDMSNGLGESGVSRLVLTPSGALIAGGYFSVGGEATRSNLAIWNGNAWVKFAGGTAPSDQPVTSLAVGSTQELLVGGQFVMAGGSPSAYFARYTFGLPLSITAHPVDEVLLPGQTAMFDVGATADPSNVYQWRRNGDPMTNGGRFSGVDTSTLQISNVQSLDQAIYSCSVSGACGNATSNGASLSCAPIVVQQPPDRLALKRSKQLTFSVPAGAPYTYQWRRDLAPLSNVAGVLAGATTRTLTFLSPEIAMWGVYDCVVTDSCGALVTAASHVCLGDLNSDALVDDADFVAFAASYELLLCTDGAMPVGCPTDFNNDTVVDDADFSYFAQSYDVLVCP
ncbi:MAG: immunoglobulin domain-containing protein [Phycisphaerae bacterium]|nr:immunoglobulin domain-containing protein [Phycisphaerae bacterium]